MFFRAITLSCLFVLLDLTQGYGQEDRTKVKVRMSDDAEAADRLLPFRLIKTADNSIVVYKVKVSGAIIAYVPLVDIEYRLDLYTMDKMELVRSISPNLSAPGGQVAMEDIIFFGGKPIFIGSQRQNSEKRFRILWQAFDPRLTRNNPPPAELATVEYSKFSGGFPFLGAETSPFGFVTMLSPDSSKLMIHSPEMRTEDGKALHFFMVVNDKMEVIWQDFISSEVKSKRSDLLAAVVDNEGVVTAWMKNNFSNRDVKNGVVDFESRIYRIGAEGQSNSEFKMDGVDYPVDVELMVLKDRTVVCGGVYGSLDEKKDKTPGSFTAVIAKDAAEFTQNSKTPFPLTGKNGDKIYEEMVVADLLRGSDGRYHMVCEVSYSYQSTVSSTTGGSRTVTKYVHGDAVVYSFDEKGVEEWSTVVPRFMNTTAYFLGNSMSVLFDDQLHLMFLDDEENIERRKRGERLEKGIDAKDARTMVLSFDDKGKYRTKVVMVTDKNADYMAGIDVFQASPNTYFTFGQRKLGSGKVVPVRVEFIKESK